MSTMAPLVATSISAETRDRKRGRLESNRLDSLVPDIVGTRRTCLQKMTSSRNSAALANVVGGLQDPDQY